VIKSGRVLAAGKTAEVLTQPVFESLYDTRLERLEQAGGRAWPIWGDPTEARR
jgi:ABC-type cobalamin transport system ATPase subunit